MNPVLGYSLIYTHDLAFKKLQIWRLYTSIFLASSGINFIFDMVILYRSGKQLESGPYSRRSADLAWQLLFACVSIIVRRSHPKSNLLPHNNPSSLNLETVDKRPLGIQLFFRPLLVCLAYLSSSLAPRGAKTSLMGLIAFPAE
ncbi:hypothetical protein FPV67DRAFT_361558 [Lyophyllum atratum]|nr:hypothetical protein FPV67DRAFT_361558 [Lyophyllum atratum]